LFVVYWGSFNSGLLREGLHVWVVTLLIVVAWQMTSSPARSWLRGGMVRVALLSRIPETLLVLMLPAVWTRPEIAQSPFAVTDITAVIVVVSGVVLLGY